MLFVWMNYVTPWHVWRQTWRQRNDMWSTSQCRREEDMCANKHPKNDGCIFNGSRDIQHTLTLGLTDPARVPVLQTEREFRRVKESRQIFVKISSAFPISILVVRITRAKFQIWLLPLVAKAKHELFHSVNVLYEIHIERLLIFTMSKPLPWAIFLACAFAAFVWKAHYKYLIN